MKERTNGKIKRGQKETEEDRRELKTMKKEGRV